MHGSSRSRNSRDEDRIPKTVVDEGADMTVTTSFAQEWKGCIQESFAVLRGLAGDRSMDFVGVFDGHDTSGEKVAEYLALNLGPFVAEQMVKTNYKNLEEVLRSSFLEVDRRLRRDVNLVDAAGNLKGGSTAVAVWFKGGCAIVANAGNSRAVMSIGEKAVPMTQDHKPALPEETKRIQSAGGFVSGGKVDGILAVSRGFGDFSFKLDRRLGDADQKVTALPDVAIYPLALDLDFIVLGSDGLWDCHSDQEVVDMVFRLLRAGQDPEKITDLVVRSCIASPTSPSDLGRDNVTLAMCFPFKNLQTSNPFPGATQGTP